MISLALAGLCAWRGRVLARREPRDFGIAAWFVAAIWWTAAAVVEVIGYLAPAHVRPALLIVLSVAPFSVVVPACLLILAGLGPRRRKRGSLTTAAIVLLGVGLGVGPFVALALTTTHHPAAMVLAGGLLALCSTLGGWFLVFGTYSWWWLRRPARPSPAAVIVLGAGLIAGEIGPLLANRLDTARVAWSTLAPTALLIPSGGQGADEPRPEGEAMAEYLIAHGVPARAIRPETVSTTTEENLRCSADILRREGVRGHALVVTSNFHAPRAALLSRRVGLDADAIGAATALPAIPAAVVREFAAVVVSDRRLHALLLIPLGALTAALVVALGLP